VFFELAQQGAFERAVLADRNPDLVAVYHALKHDVETVIKLLGKFRYDEDEYYRVRAQRPRGLCQRAARIIFLNKTGYNGLYRVNRSGQFNVPFGRHKSPLICDANNLRAAARALEQAEIVAKDFEQVCSQAGPDDAVYLDPPYLPVSKTSNFSAYDALPFGVAEHRRLADVFASLEQRRVPAVLSNSNTAATREIFGGFRHEKVQVKRPINSNASRRGPVQELLVYSKVRRRRSKSASSERADA
jgi:DNA adenine methylase